ncbi:regulator of chromosome condensation 1/beta-lactamase-inhibitor protein II [Dunaliella salina]|uniref:Regulator of chromosome condensation 1/beta-lactamase-inhibitor protein II n=1 Tax=Dunaliella salina TaxID=3046 RepID=A0ABQ7GZR2_DUNSA|nr:regulator of chromosome condensation 1/beta-lactamase-inhibitor protein II [Dunaliella salina]|eukprot:KAF5840100.1 regulator of chromosome condensation 1/beta-lactamase-inhibitor protein II [Dunaliella salina]
MVQVQRILATCGNGHLGRLGHGIGQESSKFLRIVGSLVGYEIEQVACGGAHTAVVTDDGSLFTFGQNDFGQLGHSAGDKYVAVPIEVTLPDPVVSVAAGEHHTLCLTKADEVWAWGRHESGQCGLGDGAKPKYPEPRLVKELNRAGIKELAAGAEHSMALTSAGDVLSWGAGAFGALGLGGKGAGAGGGDVKWEPQQIRGDLRSARVRSLVANYFSSGAVDDQGRAWTWGHGLHWQLGHGTMEHQMMPKQVPGLSGVTTMALGHMHALAGTAVGRLYTWGTDEFGALGRGEASMKVRLPVKTPTEVRGVSGLGTGAAPKALAAGWKHSAGITPDGRVLTWGWNGAYNEDSWFMGDSGSGQLGQGDNHDRWDPTLVQRLHTSPKRFYDLRMSYIKPWKALQISCGRNHTAAVIETELDTRDLN